MRQIVGYLPITVIAVVVVSGLLATNEIWYHQVHLGSEPIDLINPFFYLGAMLLHGDWAHYYGNMEMWVPVGITLTLLTSNRHVLLIIVTSDFLAAFVGFAVGQVGFGFSGAAFGAMAALLVRSVGVALQNTSTDALQIGVAGLLLPASAGFFMIALLAGGGPDIAHFSHFFAFFFGGSAEAIYVFSEYGDDSGQDSRSIPKGVGR